MHSVRQSRSLVFSRHCIARMTSVPAILPRPARRPGRNGLRLWGMVLLPTFPKAYPSASSLTSLRCSLYTSLPMRPTAPQIIARSKVNSASRSRVANQLILGAARPRRSSRSFCTRGPSCSREAMVPTAPANCPTKIRSRPCSMRSRQRSSSSIQVEILKPRVMGMACWSLVRPIMTRLRYSRAFPLKISRRRRVLSSTMSQASRSCRIRAVSDMSWVVAP